MGLQTKTGYSRVDRNRIFIYWFSIKLENFIINEFKTRKAGGRAYMPGRWAYNLRILRGEGCFARGSLRYLK